MHRLPEGLLGSLQPAQLAVGHPQVGVGFGVLRLQVDRLPEGLQSLLDAALPSQSHPQVVVGFRGSGVEGGGLAKGRRSLCLEAPTRLGQTQVQVGLGAVRVDPEGLKEMLSGLVRLAPPQIFPSQTEMGLGQQRIAPQGPPERCDGRSTLLPPDQPQPMVRLGIVGIDGQRPLILLGSGGMLALPPHHLGQVETGHGAVGIDVQGAFQADAGPIIGSGPGLGHGQLDVGLGERSALSLQGRRETDQALPQTSRGLHLSHPQIETPFPSG